LITWQDWYIRSWKWNVKDGCNFLFIFFKYFNYFFFRTLNIRNVHHVLTIVDSSVLFDRFNRIIHNQENHSLLSTLSFRRYRTQIQNKITRLTTNDLTKYIFHARRKIREKIRIWIDEQLNRLIAYSHKPPLQEIDK
jgi:hypothetical protein